MRNFIGLAIVLTVLSSCVSHLGFISNNNQNQTNVELSKNNFIVVGRVIGTSHANYFLGLGGFNKEGLVAEAKRKMTRMANLVGTSRALINENVEYQTKAIFPFMQVKVIATASVVEFINNETISDSVSLISDSDYENELFNSEFQEIKPKFTNGVLLGARSTSFGNYQSIIAGFKTEICWPEQSKHFFLEPQFNIDYNLGLNNLNLIIPIYAGYKTNITQKTSIFAKAGLLINYDVTSGYLETPGLGLATGLEFKNRFQGFLGFDIHENEYISGPKIGLVYLF